MKIAVGPIAVLLTCLIVGTPILSFAAVPVRGASRNGTDSGAPLWNLFAPSSIRVVTKGATTVGYKQQVVCAGRQVANSIDPADELRSGTCLDGAYIFIFQLRSDATNVRVKLSKVNGFIPDQNEPNYGVLLCDNPLNTLELCTTASEAELPNIDFNWNATSHTATFAIPSFPRFPTGKRHQGQGLTIFLATRQASPNPIVLPVLTLL